MSVCVYECMRVCVCACVCVCVKRARVKMDCMILCLWECRFIIRRGVQKSGWSVASLVRFLARCLVVTLSVQLMFSTLFGRSVCLSNCSLVSCLVGQSVCHAAV